jgi:hypothetical protein
MEISQEAPSQPGFVYVMRGVENRSDEIKVGYSTEPVRRRVQLHTSGTVWPMNIVRVWSVTNMRIAERAAHAILELRRKNDRREYFAIAPVEHYSLLERYEDTITDPILWELMDYIEDAIHQAGIEFKWEQPFD